MTLYTYEPWLVLLSCAIALTAAYAALRTIRKFDQRTGPVIARSHQLLAAIDGLTEGIIVFDERRCAVVWNSLLEQMSPAVKHVLRPGAHYDDVFAAMKLSSCRQAGRLQRDEISRERCEWEPDDTKCIEVTRSGTSAGYLVVSFVDITAHKRARDRLREFFDKAPYPFLTADRRGVIVSANRACLAIFGYERDALVGQSVCVLVPAERRAAMLNQVEHCLEAGSGVTAPADSEPQGVRRNGTVFPAEVSFGVLDFDREPLVVIGIKDRSKRLQIEAQLVQSQKMDIVGQLTGGLAHDFNNLLTVIMGNLQLLEGATDTGSDEADQIRDAIVAARRGSELTKRLLAFSRKQLLAPRPIDVGRLITDLIPLLRKSITADIEIVTTLPDSLWTVEVDPTQLENALLNLAINARDAMPDGGRLIINTGNVILDEAYASRQADVAPGKYVQIAVSDTGTGMPPEVLRQACEPFFTTKQTGRGSGLGLSTVYGFVKQSRGHVAIYSEVGFGTSVKVYLPRTAAAATSADVATASHRIVPAGDERILLVDDDHAVRRTVAQLLESLGYTVAEAGTGADALALFQQEQDFDLLLTDIVMPGGMSGIDLARKVRALVPSMKVLLTSGYTDTALFARGVLGPDDHVLNKPYRKFELAQKIRAMLDGVDGSQ